jgi:hypothetical protein
MYPARRQSICFIRNGDELLHVKEVAMLEWIKGKEG